jgi:hypothetical protein
MSDAHDDQDERDDDADEIEAESPVNVTPIRPEVRPRAQRSTETTPVPLRSYGAVPLEAQYWACHKVGLGGLWGSLSWGGPGETVELREWPRDSLTEEVIRDRWGAGEYKIQWLKATPQGGRKSISYGRPFTLRAPEASAVVPAPAAPSSPMGEGFDLAMRIMTMIDAGAEKKLDGMATMMQMMGGQSRGLGAAELQLILQSQAQATAAAITSAVSAAVEPLKKQIADLSEEEDDEDDDDAIVNAVAGAAVPKLFTGKAWWQQLAAAAFQNPDVVKAVAPMVLNTVQNVVGVVASAVTTPPPRPRAVVVQQPAQQQPAPPPPPAAVAPTLVEPSPIAPSVDAVPDASPVAQASVAE